MVIVKHYLLQIDRIDGLQLVRIDEGREGDSYYIGHALPPHQLVAAYHVTGLDNSQTAKPGRDIIPSFRVAHSCLGSRVGRATSARCCTRKPSAPLIMLVVDVTVQSHSGYVYMRLVPKECSILVRAILNGIQSTISSLLRGTAGESGPSVTS